MTAEVKYALRKDLIDGIVDPNLVPPNQGFHYKALVLGACRIADDSAAEGAHICYGGSDWKCIDSKWVNMGVTC